MTRIEPRTYHRITGVALVLLGLIVVSGAGVRLTGSGLGCSDWPTCEEGQFFADLEYHPLIEFGNRVVTGLVSLVVIAAVLGSVVRAPRRSDLTRWSLGLVAGVIGQVVLGGLLVQSHLDPRFTIGHFLLSMVLVWNAVVLYHRAGPNVATVRPRPSAMVVRLGSILFIMAMFVLGTGTIVTGAGPHGGDDAAERLNLAIVTVARIHGLSVFALLATTVTIIGLLWRTGDLARWHTALSRYLVVLVAQAGVGYTQYFTGVPPALVALHVLGATAIWGATTYLLLELRRSTVPARNETVAPSAERQQPALG